MENATTLEKKPRVFRRVWDASALLDCVLQLGHGRVADACAVQWIPPRHCRLLAPVREGYGQVDAMKNPTVKQIITEYLRANGYDGLWNDGGSCSCVTDDLAPCCEMAFCCTAGYLQRCDCGDGCEDFHIGPANQEGE